MNPARPSADAAPGHDDAPGHDETAGAVVVAAPPTRGGAARAVKRVLQAAFVALAAPWFVAYGLGRLAWGRDRAFLLTNEWLALVPGMAGVYLRQAFLGRTLARCGRDGYFGWLSAFSLPQAEVGDRVYVGRRVAIGLATLGDGAMLADGVQILSGGREHGAPGAATQDHAQVFRRVRVGAGAWVGTNAVVMADVGDGAVVGAGAVVTKPIPPRALAVGVPARVVRALSS